jgi:DNA-binding NarL/FixJ family response regulator
MSPPDVQSAERSHVLVIDPKKLRQAGIMHLLEAWADTLGLDVLAFPPSTPLRKCAATTHCDMVIIDVCDASLNEPQQQDLFKRVRAILPKASLIIVSDREDLEEVCGAFRAGAVGFMPTSIDPSVALQALSFIRSGGSFFPPSILRYVCSARAKDDINSLNRVDLPSCKVVERPMKLSGKQAKVFELLRQGLSNKVIARQLGMAEATVKVHVRGIMRKFGALNRTQVAIAALDESTSTSTKSDAYGN